MRARCRARRCYASRPDITRRSYNRWRTTRVGSASSPCRTTRPYACGNCRRLRPSPEKKAKKKNNKQKQKKKHKVLLFFCLLFFLLPFPALFFFFFFFFRGWLLSFLSA